jgi:hypothetical protein
MEVYFFYFSQLVAGHDKEELRTHRGLQMLVRFLAVFDWVVIACLTHPRLTTTYKFNYEYDCFHQYAVSPVQSSPVHSVLPLARALEPRSKHLTSDIWAST